MEAHTAAEVIRAVAAIVSHLFILPMLGGWALSKVLKMI